MNAVYPLAREAFMSGDIDLTTVDVRAALMSAAHTYSTSDEFLDDLSGLVESSSILTTPDVTGGEFSADDVAFASVTGADCTAVVFYVDSGSSATSRLLAHIDTKADASAFTLTPTGAAVTLSFAGAVFKI